MNKRKTKYTFCGMTLFKKVTENFVTRKYILGIPFVTKMHYKDAADKETVQALIQNDILSRLEAQNNMLVQLTAQSQALSQVLNSGLNKLPMDEVYKAISVRELHLKTFSNYKNIHQGKDVVLVATGQTLNNYKPIENAIHIGVNKSFRYDKVKFDYLFLQDYSGSKEYIEDFCIYKAKKFLGIISDFWPKSIIPESIALRHSIERYYVAHPDKLAKPTYDIATSILWDDYSIAFPVMQFILWTNPKRVYLVGCDCSGGYFDGDGQPFNVEQFSRGWERIKEFAEIYYPETEIISVNPVGLKGMFQDMYI